MHLESNVVFRDVTRYENDLLSRVAENDDSDLRVLMDQKAYLEEINRNLKWVYISYIFCLQWKIQLHICTYSTVQPFVVFWHIVYFCYLDVLVTLTSNKMLGELVKYIHVQYMYAWMHALYSVHVYLPYSLHIFSSTVSTLQSKLKNVKMTNDDLSTQVHKLSST